MVRHARFAASNGSAIGSAAEPAAAARVGYTGNPLEAANALFTAMLENPSGVEFGEISNDEMWQAVEKPEQRIRLALPEMLAEFAAIDAVPEADPEFPFVLSAGERRSETTNTIVRSPDWHRKGAFAALAVNPADAEKLGCAEGETVRVVTARGQGEATISLSPRMQPGHISLPNGMGMDVMEEGGRLARKGLAPNELTASHWRDPIAGTPWHKHIPARIEAL